MSIRTTGVMVEYMNWSDPANIQYEIEYTARLESEGIDTATPLQPDNMSSDTWETHYDGINEACVEHAHAAMKAAEVVTAAKGTCKCWEEKEKVLEEKFELMIANSCKGFSLEPGAVGLQYMLPLTTLDGRKPKGGTPCQITISNCPFCGGLL